MYTIVAIPHVAKTKGQVRLLPSFESFKTNKIKHVLGENTLHKAMCSYDKLIMLEITCLISLILILANPQADFLRTILSHSSLNFNQNGLLGT